MDPRSSDRQKTTTGNSKGVHKRGDGLNTGGPVGRQDAYAGRQNQTSSGTSSFNGSRAAKAGGGAGTIIIVIIVVILMLSKGSGGSTNTQTPNTNNTNSNGNVSTSSVDTSSTSSSFGNISSLFGGFASSNGSQGWQNGLNNTGKLNTDVDPSARDRYTTIKGNGEDVITIMVYMCGTDLESRGGMASNDIGEMAAANIPDNVQIILYTGGCNGWKTQGISNRVNQIYRVRSGKMELLVDDDGDRPMTDPETLTRFIKYCSENYPANRQDLIFWDHGGGSITGYGYDEKHKNEGSMDLSEINQALKASGQKFDFIGFDACLMATLETSVMVSNYADYMIASEETEPGVGWYYTKWLNALADDTSMSTVEIGKNIVDGFVDECNRVCRGQKTTLSVIDLAEFSQTVPNKLSAFSTSTSNLIQTDSYKTVSDARASTREFATSSGIDQIDLVNFANTIGSEEASALSDSVLSAVKYNRTSSSMSNAYGVSIYFPYKRASKVDTVVSINDDIGVSNDYNKCIKAFAGLETAGQISSGGTGSALGSLLGSGGASSVSGSDAIASLLGSFLGGGREIEGIDRDSSEFMDDSETFDVDTAAQYIAENQFDPTQMVWESSEDGTHTMYIPKEQWQLIQNLQVNMFVDDGEGYIDMGLDNLYYFTDDGKLIGETDNTWFSIDNQPVAFYYENTTEDEEGNGVVQGRVPVLLDGIRANLIIVFDNEHPNGYIAGARYDYVEGETDAVAKNITEIEEGTTIDFICDYYNYDKEYTNSYYLGEQITYSDDLIFSYEDVGADSQITYLLTDMYGREYWTPPVPKEQ